MSAAELVRRTRWSMRFSRRDPVRPSRLRVLTLTDSISTAGGAEKLAAEILLRLDPARFDRTICATRTYADAFYLDAFRKAGVRVIRLERQRKWDLAAWWPLFGELCETDVIHTHRFGSNVWGVLWGRLARVPVIVAHEHTWSYEGHPLRRFLDRELIARGASVFVMVSREDQRRAHTIERIQPSRTRYMPNGVATLEQSGKNIRAELGISDGAPVIGTISGLRPQKALDVLIRAAAELKHSFPDLQVLVAGRGPEQGRLKSLITELGLAETVHLLGRREDVADLVAIFDVAVLSSDFEGSPLSVMEYMSAGKAIVATRVGGVPDLIDDGVHGLLVERRDERGLAAAIAALLNDPERRKELGRAALERQRREFDINQAVRRFEQLYDDLYSKKTMHGASKDTVLDDGELVLPVEPADRRRHDRRTGLERRTNNTSVSAVRERRTGWADRRSSRDRRSDRATTLLKVSSGPQPEGVPRL